MKDPTSDVRPHIKAMVEEMHESGDQISLVRYKRMALNSFEREWILPFMDDECLIYRIEHALNFCEHKEDPNRPPVTYDQAVIHSLMPEILARFRRLTDD